MHRSGCTRGATAASPDAASSATVATTAATTASTTTASTGPLSYVPSVDAPDDLGAAIIHRPAILSSTGTQIVSATWFESSLTIHEDLDERRLTDTRVDAATLRNVPEVSEVPPRERCDR